MIAAALVLFTLLCLALGLGHAWSDETHASRNELVFADRNRDYGAYRLRSGYGNRVGLAMLAAVGILGAAAIIPSAIAHFRPPAHVDAPAPVVVDVDLSRVFVLPPEPPKLNMSKAAPVAPPTRQDPDVQHFVQAVDSAAEPPLPDLDTARTAAVPDPGKGSGPGGADPGPGPGLAAGTEGAGGTSVWNDYDVQEVPAFPGGEEAMRAWVQRNLDFPPDGAGKDMVYVQFTIGLDGSVEDVKAVKGKQAAYRNAAERTMRRMPRWKPARMNGHDVRCRLTLPIRFETR